jgi:H+/Cl- antiporter ClcA
LPAFLSASRQQSGFYALAAMAGMFGGIARAPFTNIVFLFELSHNPNSLLPLIVDVIVSDGFVRLFSRIPS